ncbi:hypothetical protein FKM82_027165 [Ascaphus truei]
MAGLVYPHYPVFPCYGAPYRQRPPFYKPKQQQYWRPPYKGAPGPMKPMFPIDRFDSYKWAQLKALLNQLGPELGLSLPYTREVGVQVNARVDASVQCSLGPRTLRTRKGGPILCHAVPGQQAGLSLISPVRFPCTIAVYSRLSDRRLFTLPSLPRGELEEAGALQPFLRPPQAPALSMKGEAGARKPAFQFLEERKWVFNAGAAEVRWESAYVWFCVSGTKQGTHGVYFKQFCHKCQKGYNPYYVEGIECQTCNKTVCSCPERRHIDLKRPHLQELCGRCKGQRLSCDKTFSFKYII